MGGALSYTAAVFGSDWSTTSLIAAALIIGIVFVRFSIIELKSISAATTSEADYKPGMGSAFTAYIGWRTFPPAASDEVNRQLLLQRNQMLAYGQFGMGVGEILSAVVVTGLMFGLYSTGGQGLNSQLTLGLGSIVLLTGAVLGYAPGVLSLRRNNRSAALFIGARRTMRDYCSPLIWVVPLVTSTLSAALLFDASLGAHPLHVHWFGVSVSIHAPVIGALISTALVLPVGLPLLLSATVARTPNILTSPDMWAAQRANDDLRAFMSATLVFLAWMSAEFPGPNLSSLYSALAAPAPSGALGVLSTAISLFQALIAFGMVPTILVAVMMASGRMGGRLTGWPWGRSHHRRQPAIEE